MIVAVIVAVIVAESVDANVPTLARLLTPCPLMSCPMCGRYPALIFAVMCNF